MTRFISKVMGDDALRDLQERWLEEDVCVGVTEANNYVGGGVWHQAKYSLWHLCMFHICDDEPVWHGK